MNLDYSKEKSQDWRVDSMKYLDKFVVYEARGHKIHGYTCDDLAQELRLHIWKNLHKYNPYKSNLKTWANNVMRNKLIDLDRGQTKTQKRRDFMCESLYTIRENRIVFYDNFGESQ